MQRSAVNLLKDWKAWLLAAGGQNVYPQQAKRRLPDADQFLQKIPLRYLKDNRLAAASVTNLQFVTGDAGRC